MLYIPKSFAQLAAGDIAFIGYNTDSGPTAGDDHSFSFITLNEIPANELIYFTEEGWNDSTNVWMGTTEGHILWTAPNTITPCGTVIYISETGDSIFTVTGGGSAIFTGTSGQTDPPGGTGWSLSGGDQILAYQGTSQETASPTFIAGINGDDGATGSVGLSPTTGWNIVSTGNSTGSNPSGLPLGLTNGVNCVSLFVASTEVDNARYTGTLTGTSTALRAAINNHQNWTTVNTNPVSIIPSSYSPSVTCTTCTEPDVPTVTYTPTTVCNGGTASLNISGDLNDATVWNVYTGSCGGTLIGSTTTGSFAIPGTISSTTDYFVRGEGDCATLGSCGSATVTVAPNEDAAFFYGSTSYCTDASDPSAILFPGTTTGGSFSSTIGLSLASATGIIDLSDSTAGTYTITYITSGTCFDTATYDITINALDDASFSYGATSYNTNDSDPTPVANLSGGTFSSTTGLSIDPSNGEIDLSASTLGFYTITYMTAGPCPSSSTTNVTLVSSEYTWTGAFDNTWNISLNWSPTSVPPNNADITIPNGLANYPTASTAVTFNSLAIESGATFIAQSTATGTVTYTRNLPDTDWHLIASPVEGESMDNLIANHTFANGTTGGNIGLASYNNFDTSGDPGAPWNYANIASSDTLFPLMGYSVKLDAPGDLSFTGTINTDATALYLISNGARTSFNLLGNPYTSYLDLANFLNFNTSEFDDVAQGIWIWNGTDYMTYNAASNFKIAPTQGFFVKAANPLDTQIVQLFSSDQSHESTDTFQKQEPNPSFDLFIDNNSSKKSTKVYYIAGKTTGLDKGYDTEMFGDTSYDLAVYTELVADNMGDHLAIQTIPTTYDAVIPVGIIAKAGEEITFSIESLNLPEGTDVFLEDKTNNEFVNLSKTTYKTTLTEDINTTGRFYIHTSAKSLNTLDIVENNNNISIYKSSEQTITVTGLNGVGKINIYSLLGKEVLNTPLSSNGSSIVNLPSLSGGVYMVKLTSDGISKSTKITLN